MLGSFLEIGIGTDDIATTYRAFQSLGFSAVTPGDVRGSGYAVISDGDAYFGLYDGHDTGVTLTFVRPELERYVRVLRRHGVEIDFTNLGDQEFHELGFRDRDGQRIKLVEARTFSPIVAESGVQSACGRFLEFSLPVRSLDESRAYWLALGCRAVADGTEPHPWCRVAATGMTLGLHETATFAPGACFTATQLDARIDFLRAKGFSVDRRAPQQSTARLSATLAVGDAAVLYLVADPADAA